MSKKFRIAKRISMENINFEDVVVEYDFIDKDMAQIISDNEYDPMYDDCESIAVALQLAGYGKVADLEAKLAEKEKEIEKYRNANMIVLGGRGQGKKHLMQIKIKEIQNQKAIELLQELLEKTQTLNLMVKSEHYVNQKQVKVVFEDIIMQKISELKGDGNEKEN